MKKVISGKVYDTDTSVCVGEIEHGYINDLNYIRETLYKSQRGNYFIHYVGGANTRYAVSKGNNWYSGSEGILPLTKGEALEWCERNNIAAETIEREFADMVEDA